MVAIVGLLLGFCIGVTISFAGFFSFELAMVAMALFVAYQTYMLTFQRTSSSDDLPSYLVGLLMLIALISLLLVAGRWSLVLEIDATRRVVLFSMIFSVIGLGLYGYVLCLQEDERKHHLDVCTADGDVLEEPNAIGTTDLENWEAFFLFLRWICSWQWWFDCRASEAAPSDEESTLVPGEGSESCDTITVHNRTLKLIKVCFYSPEDMFCFVPFGGISGNCVGLIRAEECRPFRMPRRIGTVPADHYTMKVFQPGVFDRELACYSKARDGQTFAFFDVEGMVKRSRVLSSVRAPAEPKALLPQSDTSDDELAGKSRVLPEGLLKSDKDTGACSPTCLGSSGGLKRNSSSISLYKSSEESCGLRRLSSPGASTCTPTSIPEVRKAKLDEVVVRNRSNQEIRALLFRSNDYCYMIPLVGKLMACGDCILPDSERRFTPRVTDKDFTLKVYSVGAGARELTYLTVSRGNTYTFCNSLLS